MKLLSSTFAALLALLPLSAPAPATALDCDGCVMDAGTSTVLDMEVAGCCRAYLRAEVVNPVSGQCDLVGANCVQDGGGCSVTINWQYRSDCTLRFNLDGGPNQVLTPHTSFTPYWKLIQSEFYTLNCGETEDTTGTLKAVNCTASLTMQLACSSCS